MLPTPRRTVFQTIRYLLRDRIRPLAYLQAPAWIRFAKTVRLVSVTVLIMAGSIINSLRYTMLMPIEIRVHESCDARYARKIHFHNLLLGILLCGLLFSTG